MKGNRAKDNTRSAIDCATPSGGACADAQPRKKRSPQAEARRVAIPFAAALTLVVAVGLLSGVLVDRNAIDGESLGFVLSALCLALVLAGVVWAVAAGFGAGRRAWRESRARSEAARGRLAGRSARHRAGGRDTLSPADPALSRYRHMKWYHGGTGNEDR